MGGTVNRQQASQVQAVIAEMRPDAKVDVSRQPDGATVTINGSEPGSSASGPHSPTDVRLSMSDDGPLMRFLFSGYPH
jgi:hypothetical protein